MGIIGWVLLGLLAGAIAKALHPGDDPGGALGTMAIGIAGALLGGFIASAVGLGGLSGFFDAETWALAIGGAFVLLTGARAVERAGRPGRDLPGA